MSHEEILWLQKSRQDWLLLVDRNISYFHQKTLSRRRRNNITAIQDSSGVWIYENDKIKDHTIQFFSTLYSCEHRELRPYPPPNYFSLVDDALLTMLKDIVDDTEIKKTVFDIHPLKAPGPHRFYAIFY